MESLRTSRCIPISSQPEVPEWVLIELNGELLPPVAMPSQIESESILGIENQAELGRLLFLTKNEKNPLLILGSHQLKGKAVDLKEDFVVLEKNYDPELNGLSSYDPVGIIKKKLIFNEYPKVIMK